MRRKSKSQRVFNAGFAKGFAKARQVGRLKVKHTAHNWNNELRMAKGFKPLPYREHGRYLKIAGSRENRSRRMGECSHSHQTMIGFAAHNKIRYRCDGCGRIIIE
jgi:hypothetical protein